MFETGTREGVLRVHRPDARWLSTGWDGGFVRADAAYVITVPEGWDRTDVTAYVEARRERAGFIEPGPALLTGVDLEHARVARDGPVGVVATAGVSNPAALPMEPPDESGPSESSGANGPGTVNLLIVVDRAVDDAGLATLVALAGEAKAATLLDLAGFPGTTTDAVAVGCNPAAESVAFAGSATEVGAATRACVRDAVRASFHSRYATREVPATVADAKYGVVTDREPEVSRP